MAAYDPADYLTATALSAFTPLTDAIIVLDLVRSDAPAGRTEPAGTYRHRYLRAHATHVAESLALLLRCEATIGDGWDGDHPDGYLTPADRQDLIDAAGRSFVRLSGPEQGS